MNRLGTHAMRVSYWPMQWPVVLGWTSIAAACGVALALEPRLAPLPVAAIASVALVLSARVRVVVVVFGALTVFQSSDELTLPKLGYSMALVVAVGAILWRLPYLSRTAAYTDLKPMLRASVVTMGLIACSLPVAHLNGVPFTSWLRDIAPYVMVASAPLFALDAQASMSARSLRRLLVAGGTLGALAFTVRWLTNRQITDLSFVPVGLPTLLLASTVFAYGIAVLLHGNQRRLAWAALTAFVLAMLVSTGTRTSLVLLLAPLAIVVGSRRRFAQRSVRLVVAAPLVAVLVFLGVEVVVRATNADRDALAARTSLLLSTGDRRADMSYIDRLAQTAAAWDAFRSSPVLGTGPGKPIVWTDSLGREQSWTVIDSPVSFLTKFGLIGLIAAAFLAAGYVATVRRLSARTGARTVSQLALVGYGAVIVGWSLLQNPYEDKGFAIGLILLLAVASREAADAPTSRRG